MTPARDAFLKVALEQLGKDVLWNNDGPDVFDCSGLVAFSLLRVRGPDLRATHTAQRMHDETPDLLTHVEPTSPLPGDLVFWGSSASSVVHVAIWLAGGRVLSASGASSKRTTLAAAKAHGDRVRIHDSVKYRPDPYLAVHRNTWLDAIDSVCR